MKLSWPFIKQKVHPSTRVILYKEGFLRKREKVRLDYNNKKLLKVKGSKTDKEKIKDKSLSNLTRLKEEVNQGENNDFSGAVIYAPQQFDYFLSAKLVFKALLLFLFVFVFGAFFLAGATAKELQYEDPVFRASELIPVSILFLLSITFSIFLLQKNIEEKTGLKTWYGPCSAMLLAPFVGALLIVLLEKILLWIGVPEMTAAIIDLILMFFFIPNLATLFLLQFFQKEEASFYYKKL